MLKATREDYYYYREFNFIYVPADDYVLLLSLGDEQLWCFGERTQAGAGYYIFNKSDSNWVLNNDGLV